MRYLLTVFLVILFLNGCSTSEPPADNVPAWATNAVWYQIFPERFENGDPSNDPTRSSLEFPEEVPTSWQVSSWTADWYHRASWEKQMGSDFYEHGVYHRRYGGDLQGVINRLDYLDSLGINAIYFNPVFYARSLHKYDGNSFHHIDPFFGPRPQEDLRIIRNERTPADPSTWQWTAADSLFIQLLEKAHARNIRVVIDGVFNHTGRDFFAFKDLREKQKASKYKDWYIVRSYDDPSTSKDEFEYQGWWGVETLPVFSDNADSTNLHPGPKDYVLAATRRWMDPNGDGNPSDGVDGWRLDVTKEVPIKFWQDWNAHVRAINPQAYTVTEIWDDAGEFIKKGGFSASMNYHGFAFPAKKYFFDQSLTASAFARKLKKRRSEITPPIRYAMQNLIESHDTDRLASMIVNRSQSLQYDRNNSPRSSDSYKIRRPNSTERKIQRLFVLFQMSYVGAPMIYYGTEAGMWGADDPDDRMPMVWPNRSYEPQSSDPRGSKRVLDPVKFKHELFSFYRSAIRLRRAQPALRKGSFQLLAADDTLNTLAYARRYENNRLLIVLNRSHEPQTVSLPVNQEQAPELLLLSAGSKEQVTVEPLEQAVQIHLPALSGAVLK